MLIYIKAVGFFIPFPSSHFFLLPLQKKENKMICKTCNTECWVSPTSGELKCNCIKVICPHCEAYQDYDAEEMYDRGETVICWNCREIYQRGK